MADPKQIADALAQDQLLAQFNRDEASAEPWYRKGLPMEGRDTFLPFKYSQPTLPGSVMNQRELALPGLLAGAVNQFTSGGRAYTGSDPTFNPQEEAANFAMNTFGGGMATGKMMRNPTGVGGTDLALNVYHGTPHEIKGGFDLSKVGTGEGAQAYGYGTYFAENPIVAEEYKKILSSKIDVNGKPLYRNNNIVGSTGNKELDDYLVANIGNVKATKKQLLGDIKEIRTGNPQAAKEMQQTLAELRKANVNTTSSGNLYKADIPDAQIPMMLNWDKPVNLQSQEVKTILTGLAKETPMWTEYAKTLTPESLKIAEDLLTGVKPISGTESVKYWKQLQTLSPNANHNAITDSMSAIGISDPNKVLGRDVYNTIASTFDVGQKEAYKLASEYLAQKGITGVRYLDDGSRNWRMLTPDESTTGKYVVGKWPGGGAEQKYFDNLADAQAYLNKNKTSNFVSFQPKTVNILEKNGQPTRKELLQQEFDKLDK